MKNFIEVTNLENKKVSLNVNYIIKLDDFTNMKIKGRIFVALTSDNKSTQEIHTLETYNEIKQLIADSF